MAWINDYQKWLSEEESLSNAENVFIYFANSDWSKESLSAMVGNMRIESSVNPNMYEFRYNWEDDRGFGLVQWTPRSKYWNWALARGYTEAEIRNGDAQLDRIQWEIEDNGSTYTAWIPNGHAVRYGKESKYDFSFKDFRTNVHGLSIEELTEAFIWNYEGPNYEAGLSSIPDRQAFAIKAYNAFSGNDYEGGEGGDKPTKRKGLPIYMMIKYF